jgi:alkylated DNA repair dioxygenase AlkB
MADGARQPSLFDLGPTCVSGAPWARTALDDSCWVALSRGWLSGADALLGRLLAELPLRQGRRVLFERWVDEPRLSSPLPLRDAPPVVSDMVAALDAEFGCRFRGCFVNYYRDGVDSVAWHRDRDHLVRRDPLVAIVSLGGPRRFHLRPYGGGPAQRLVLHSGDALVMGGSTQHRWEHAVPKMPDAYPRMSLSFREGSAAR